MQAIANTAGFHFAFIEQGGSSLYSVMALKASSLEVLRIIVSIGGVETNHFSLWHDKAGNAVAQPLAGVTDPRDRGHLPGPQRQGRRAQPDQPDPPRTVRVPAQEPARLLDRAPHPRPQRRRRGGDRRFYRRSPVRGPIAEVLPHRAPARARSRRRRTSGPLAPHAAPRVRRRSAPRTGRGPSPPRGRSTPPKDTHAHQHPPAHPPDHRARSSRSWSSGPNDCPKPAARSAKDSKNSRAPSPAPTTTTPTIRAKQPPVHAGDVTRCGATR